MGLTEGSLQPFRPPEGRLGRPFDRGMNSRHSWLFRRTLSRIPIEPDRTRRMSDAVVAGLCQAAGPSCATWESVRH
jgi:hypothetical protein